MLHTEQSRSPVPQAMHIKKHRVSSDNGGMLGAQVSGAESAFYNTDAGGTPMPLLDHSMGLASGV